MRKAIAKFGEISYYILKFVIQYRLYIIIWTLIISSRIYNYKKDRMPNITDNSYNIWCKAWFVEMDYINNAIDLRLEKGNVKFRLSTVDIPLVTNENKTSCEHELGIITRHTIEEEMSQANNIEIKITTKNGEISFGDIKLNNYKLSKILIEKKLAYQSSHKQNNNYLNWCFLLEAYKSQTHGNSIHSNQSSAD